jgi:hypothetical protein
MSQQDGKGQDEEERLAEMVLHHKRQLGTRVRKLFNISSQTNADRAGMR